MLNHILRLLHLISNGSDIHDECTEYCVCVRERERAISYVHKCVVIHTMLITFQGSYIHLFPMAHIFIMDVAKYRERKKRV